MIDLGLERGSVVYIAYPYARDPARSRGVCRAVSRRLVEAGYVPLAVQLLLPQYLDEGTERETAMAQCLALLRSCDALLVVGGDVTEGMRAEVAWAENAPLLPIPIRHASELDAAGPEPSEGWVAYGRVKGE